MNKRLLTLTVLALIALLAVACDPGNPPLNSVITAHGNTDWHIDTAEEFLYGTEMSGSTTAANHVPSSWSRRHMHIGQSNMADFYYDADLIATGDDTNATNGIDTAMLFFYAGHGNPVLWNTLGNNASQGNMSLADSEDDGLLRYYWQCSCEVFAHGPRNCPGASFVHTCPGDFDGSADSFDHRNVYERWGPVLNDDLRMACGASTDAYCHESQTNKIWNNYNNNGYDVADSFIDGLTTGEVVPLCITKSGFDVTQSPLYDQTFTNQRNTSGNSYLHIQYLDQFASNPPLLVFKLPEELPILLVEIPPLPDPILELDLEQEEEWLVSAEEIEGRGARVRVNPASNAVYLRGEQVAGLDERVLSEDEYINLALEHLGSVGLLGDKSYNEPQGAHMMLAKQAVDRSEEDEEARQKNVIVTFKRVIDLDGQPVSVLGEGGVMRVQMNNDGSMLNTAVVWREVVDAAESVAIKSFDEALEEALAQVENAENYQLDTWNWGYKEFAGNVEQTELRPIFQFTFIPLDPEMIVEYPPQLVEITAEQQ